MDKQEQLLIILYDLSQTINSETKLQPLLKKLLQRLMYHTGYTGGLIFNNEKTSDSQIHLNLQIAIGDRQSKSQVGSFFDPKIFPTDKKYIDLSKLPVRQDHYHTQLILPIPDYGLILLLGVEEYVPHAYEQIFAPVLANLTKSIRLCQHSEMYTDSLIADRDRAKSNNERFRQALDTSSDFILLIDPETGNIIDFNLSSIRRLGYSNNELFQLHLDDLIEDAPLNLVVDLINRLQVEPNGEVVDSYFKCKKGNRFPVEVRFSLLKQENNLMTLIAVVSDITQRKKSEEDLFKSKQLAETTLNSIGDAVITTDAEGNIVRMNPVAEDLTGWKLREVIGQPLKSIFTIIHASTRKAIPNPVETVLATGETVYLSNHTTLISKSGKEYQISDSAAAIRNGDDNILGMVLVFNDVTERYHLREAAAKHQAQVGLLLNSTAEAIYGIDIDGKCTFVNQSCLTMLGYKDETELLGKNMHDLIHYKYSDGSDYPVDQCHIIKTIQTKDQSHIDNEVFWRKDGSCFAAEYWSHPIFQDDICIGAVVTFMDITSKKQSDEIVRRSQKMQALGKLTGGIAHDYNNMLGVVLGYAELLESMLGDRPELIEFTNEITHSAERGVKLTNKLLSFSRQKSSDAEVLNLNDALQDERDMLEKTLTVRIKLNFDLVDNIWPVNIDSAELEDAVVNMCINSMHAIDEQGELTIQTRNEKLSATDAKALHVKSGDYVLLSITDTGHGMDEETKENIFEPFYSTKGDSGTGLGLSQVYGFVERSHGAIKVYSECGLGSRLTLYFPRYIEPEINGAENDFTVDEKINSDTDLTGTETILIVDDEAGLRKITSKILKQHGYNVFSAESGRQALGILEKENIDVLFSDVIMPEMDGYQLAEIVRKKYPLIKIQLASGFSDERHNTADDDTLHKNLLNKPYHSQALLKKIRELLN